MKKSSKWESKKKNRPNVSVCKNISRQEKERKKKAKHKIQPWRGFLTFHKIVFSSLRRKGTRTSFLLLCFFAHAASGVEHEVAIFQVIIAPKGQTFVLNWNIKVEKKTAENHCEIFHCHRLHEIAFDCSRMSLKIEIAESFCWSLFLFDS